MEQSEKRRIAEALILGSVEPISGQRIAEIIPYCKPKHVKGLVDELNADYIKTGRAFEIVEVAGGYQFRTLPEFAPYLQQTLKTRALRLSQAALETLAVIAYRQPVTRAEIEHVRGVDVGAVIRSLVERKLVRIAGHRDVPGRPMLYGTTKRFLEVFELSHLDELPSLRDLKELAPDEALAGPEPTQAAGAEAAASGEPGEPELASPDERERAASGEPGEPEPAASSEASEPEDASAAEPAAPAQPAPDEPPRPVVVAAPAE